MRTAITLLAFLFSSLVFASGDPVVDLVMHKASKQSETPAELRYRAGTIRDAVYRTAKHPSERAAILVIWEGETRFALNVHAGGLGKWGSDNGRAKCLGQIHSSRLTPKHEWEKLGGVDLAATERCAEATLKLLKAKMRYCVEAVVWNRETVAISFQAYATGRCEAPGAMSLKRARSWLQLRAALAD